MLGKQKIIRDTLSPGQVDCLQANGLVLQRDRCTSRRDENETSVVLDMIVDESSSEGLVFWESLWRRIIVEVD